MTTENRELADKNSKWDIYVKRSEVAYKVLILIIGSVVAAVFLFLQNRQTESHYYTDFAAQRERADTDLRAEMFKILFEAYFKNKIQLQDSDTGSAKSTASVRPGPLMRPHNVLEGLQQETILADLLARNFDNIDVRPLLEDLDGRLTAQIYPIGAKGGASPTEQQRQAFKQRQQLRRVAFGATSRQIAALEGLSGEAKAQVTYHGIDLCVPDPDHAIQKKIDGNQLIELVKPPLPQVLPDNMGPVTLRRVRDGALDLQIFKLAAPHRAEKEELGGSDINLSVTFFDMPALENLRLNNGARVAFSLYQFISKRDCDMFEDILDGPAQENCAYLRQSPRQDCALAQFRMVILGQKFLGIHDRPYVNDLVSGKYRDSSWWKFW
jgi:hypothetical protein